MDIEFKTNRLAKIFNSEDQLYKAYGKKTGAIIMRRLILLLAAGTLEDVPHTPPTRRHQLSGARKGEYAIDVGKKDRLIFKPAHNPLPLKEDGGLDLKRVTKIIILGVEDYH
ncbi:MAG: type II toxin-antitoxin system RelE/ParE family toxin [Thermodesulfobacteriota bacterium]